jgi:hypothetical protein
VEGHFAVIFDAVVGGLVVAAICFASKRWWDSRAEELTRASDSSKRQGSPSSAGGTNPEICQESLSEIKTIAPAEARPRNAGNGALDKNLRLEDLVSKEALNNIYNPGEHINKILAETKSEPKRKRWFGSV